MGGVLSLGGRSGVPSASGCAAPKPTLSIWHNGNRCARRANFAVGTSHVTRTSTCIRGGVMMIHISQREDYDCGITVAAMVAGLTYEQAREADPRQRPIPPGRGLHVREMIEMFESVYPRVKWRFRLVKWRPPVSKYQPPPSRGAMLTRSDDTDSHWVAYRYWRKGLYIYDPAGEVLPALKYWGAVGVSKAIYPADPAEVERQAAPRERGRGPE